MLIRIFKEFLQVCRQTLVSEFMRSLILLFFSSVAAAFGQTTTGEILYSGGLAQLDQGGQSEAAVGRTLREGGVIHTEAHPLLVALGDGNFALLEAQSSFQRVAEGYQLLEGSVYLFGQSSAWLNGITLELTPDPFRMTKRAEGFELQNSSLEPRMIGETMVPGRGSWNSVSGESSGEALSALQAENLRDLGSGIKQAVETADTLGQDIRKDLASELRKRGFDDLLADGTASEGGDAARLATINKSVELAAEAAGDDAALQPLSIAGDFVGDASVSVGQIVKAQHAQFVSAGTAFGPYEAAAQYFDSVDSITLSQVVGSLNQGLSASSFAAPLSSDSASPITPVSSSTMFESPD